MTEKTQEHLSSLMDGEINRDTSRFLVKRLGTDEDLRQTWDRWHAVRDCLRYPGETMASDDLCQRVSAALENEQQPAKSVSVPAWIKPVSGLAVAASVALMAVFAVGPQVAQEDAIGTPAAATASFTSPQGFVAPNRSQQVSTNGGSNEDDARMNSYLLRHYQATGSAAAPKFVTFVPIIASAEQAATDAEQDPTPTEDLSEAQPD